MALCVPRPTCSPPAVTREPERVVAGDSGVEVAHGDHHVVEPVGHGDLLAAMLVDVEGDSRVLATAQYSTGSW